MLSNPCINNYGDIMAKYIVLFFAALLSLGTHAHFLDLKPSENLHFILGTYVLPNENYPDLAVGTWKKSGTGIYISVGTDRAFLGAAASNATYLLALDTDPGIVVYNRMMIEMLKLANDGRDLQKMRTNFDYLKEKFELAKNEGKKMNFAFIDETLENPKWQLLINHSMSNYDQNKLHWMWRDDNERSEVIYWKNPILFAKMKKMAVDGHIQAELFDFSDAQRLKELEKSIHNAHLDIAILDLSNAWKESYLGAKGITQIVNILGPVFKNTSILLFTWLKYKGLPIEYAGIFVKNFDTAVFSDDKKLKSRAVSKLLDSLKLPTY